MLIDRLNTIGAAFLVAAVLVPSVAVAQQPEWISGKSKKYPDQVYITGVGGGATREAAESQARANIGRVFRVDLKSTFQVTRQEEMQQKEGRTSSEIKEKTVAKVDVGLTKTLEGTEIAEVWKDQSNKTFYALAVLERQKAAQILEERIRQIDNDVTILNEQLRPAEDRVGRMRLTVRKKNLLTMQKELNADYRVVTRKRLQTQYSYEKELSGIDRFLKNEFMLGIEGKGDNVARLVEATSKFLTARGLTIRKVTEKNKSNLDVIISLEFSMNPATQAVDDWYYCPWQLSVQAVDREYGNVLAADVTKGRASQLSVEEAKKRALFDASKQVEALAASVVKGLFEE